jgi:hypothetical protein
MSLNKVITSVNALSENIVIPADQSNNVVCIDTFNNSIGIKTANPECELDVRGTTRTQELQISDTGNGNPVEFTFANSILTLSNVDKIEVPKTLDCSYLTVNEISTNSIACSYLTVNEISANSIKIDSLSLSSLDISNINNIDGTINVNSDISFSGGAFFNNKVNFYADIDTSINTPHDICCNNLTANFIDISYINSVNTISGDVTFTGNVTFDNSLTVLGNLLPSSDDRLKHNEIIINNGLEVIRQLEPQFYQKTKTFKEVDFSGIVTEPYFLEAGLIAQDVHKIDDLKFTVAVGNDTTPYYLNYNSIFVYGLAAIKQLDNVVSKHFNTSNNYENINIGNIENLIKSQNLLIQNMNSKITILENKINSLEEKIV